MKARVIYADLEEIGELVGNGVALTILAAKRGSKVYIPHPSRLDENNWLVILVGKAVATTIAERFAGHHVEIPMMGGGSRGKSWQALHKALQNGHDTATAARLAGVSQRTARRHKNGHVCKDDEDEDQPQLALDRYR